MTKMKTLTMGGTTYEIVDEAARNRITALEENGGGGTGSANAVLYTEQLLTEEQKAQARANIGIGDLPVFEKIGDGETGGGGGDSGGDTGGGTVAEEYNLITLATEVSTAEEFLAFDGIALLKDYEYNGVSTKVNADDKYWVLKVPVQAGDVIRNNTASYWQKTTVTAAYQYIGFYDASGTLITNNTTKPYQPIRLVFDRHPSEDPTYLEIRANGVTAPTGSVYALVNVYRDYYVNDTTQYKNGREASIVTLNKDASLTVYDGTYQLDNYVPVADRETSVVVASEDTSTESYYRAVDDVRIPRYEDALAEVNASLADVETILANVVGGV